MSYEFLPFSLIHETNPIFLGVKSLMFYQKCNSQWGDELRGLNRLRTPDGVKFRIAGDVMILIVFRDLEEWQYFVVAPA